MSEKQDKESKMAEEKVAAAKYSDTNLKNAVTADNIRKETNCLENVSQLSWQRKYEHLSGRFLNEVLVEECRKAGLPLDTFERDPPEDAVERSPIPLKASPAVPKTTSATIGHRSSRAEYSLEFVGRLYISPKWTIEPPTDTPVLRATQQKLIFLG